MKLLKKILLSLSAILFPVFAILSSIRLVLTPLFINFEYRLPGFPIDSYGFSTADRLYWGQYSIDYLLGKISHNKFSTQLLPDNTPLFNTREISHMLDVRNLTMPVLSIWTGVCLFFLFVLSLSYLQKWLPDFLKSLKKGGVTTILLIGLVLFSVWLNFDQLFTRFHQIFFKGDSWLFYLSDNLIRLFPIRFWRDLFIFIGAAAIIFSLLPIIIFRVKSLPLNQKTQ